MKEKMKKIFKNRIFIFVLGGLLFSGVTVYAVTYFPSNQVTYDNKESGLKSTDVQGAIDELYNTCFPSTIIGGNGLLENVEIVTSGDGLYKDEYEDGRYFYRGANPNNYVSFNAEKAGWRIISINSDGTIKIIKNNSTENKEFNSSGTGSWSNSSINTYLNNTFYSNLTLESQNKIVSHDFSVGVVSENNNDIVNQIQSENMTKWNGKIGFISVSEYLRANSNYSQCRTYQLNNSNSVCKNTNWLVTSYKWWTISEFNNYLTYYINDDGNVYGNELINSYAVRPVLYISSSVQITGGDGSQSNPYTFE